MQDFRGNNIQDGDMVIACYSYRPYMEIGTIIDGKVRTLESITRTKAFREIYLINNPTQEELDLKEEILDKMEKSKIEKKQRAKELSKYKGNMIGGIYSTTEGSTYLYLGKIKKEILDSNGNVLESDEGNCYYRYMWNQKEFDKITKEDVWNPKNRYYMQFLKGFKNITGLAGIHPRFSMSDFRDIIGNYKFKIEQYDYSTKKFEEVERIVRITML